MRKLIVTIVAINALVFLFYAASIVGAYYLGMKETGKIYEKVFLLKNYCQKTKP